jgi:hypothetical protein
VDGADTLLTTAEVAVALAGFSGVVVVLGRPSLSDWTPVDVLRLQVLLGVSLGAVILALLPLAFHHVGLTHALVIGLSSSLMGGYILIAGVLFQRSIRGLSPESRQSVSGGLTGVLSAIWLLVFVVIVLNAIGIVFQHEFGVYFFSLLWFLVVAAVQFARIMLVRFRVRE